MITVAQEYQLLKAMHPIWSHYKLMNYAKANASNQRAKEKKWLKELLKQNLIQTPQQTALSKAILSIWHFN